MFVSAVEESVQFNLTSDKQILSCLKRFLKLQTLSLNIKASIK